ncbi:MAG: mobilization protein [Cyanobacteria bacterium J06642_2]
MTTIHLVDGEKGGVGKSLFAHILIQHCIDRGILHETIETDRSNPDILKIFGAEKVKMAVFSEDPEYHDSANDIFDLSLEHDSIVSLPSQCHHMMMQWFERMDLFTTGQQHNVAFQKWFLTDGMDDSISLLVRSLESFAGNMPHVVVRNHALNKDWTFFEAHEALQKLVKKGKCHVIDLPHLSPASYRKLNIQRLTLGAAREHTDFKVLGRQVYITFMRRCSEQIDSTGIFPLPAEGTQTKRRASKTAS